jgi:hypothetical protein
MVGVPIGFEVAATVEFTVPKFLGELRTAKLEGLPAAN